MRPDRRSSSRRPSRPRREIRTNYTNQKKDFLSYFLPDVNHLMSITMEMLVPISSYGEELHHLRQTNRELYNEVYKIGTNLANEIILPIVKTEYQSNNPISYSNVERFMGYCSETTNLISRYLEIKQIGKLNLQIFQNTKERLDKQQRLSDESIETAKEIINILIDYIEHVVVMIEQRKPDLEKALEEIDKNDLFRSLYGTILSFVCFSVILGVKKMKDEERFSVIVNAGLDFANDLDGYIDTLDILTSPEELKLFRKTEE